MAEILFSELEFEPSYANLNRRLRLPQRLHGRPYREGRKFLMKIGAVEQKLHAIREYSASSIEMTKRFGEPAISPSDAPIRSHTTRMHRNHRLRPHSCWRAIVDQSPNGGFPAATPFGRRSSTTGRFVVSTSDEYTNVGMKEGAASQRIVSAETERSLKLWMSGAGGHG